MVRSGSKLVYGLRVHEGHQASPQVGGQVGQEHVLEQEAGGLITRQKGQHQIKKLRGFQVTHGGEGEQCFSLLSAGQREALEEPGLEGVVWEVDGGRLDHIHYRQNYLLRPNVEFIILNKCSASIYFSSKAKI